MNKHRRKYLDTIRIRLEEAKADLSDVQDEEQEYYDNMPDGIQESDKGERAYEVIDHLDTAYALVTEAIEQIEEAVQ